MRLFRKRLNPEEIRELRDDTVVFRDADKIITKWTTINPKIEFSHGASCYFVDEGYKISKIYGDGNEFKFYYCDIIFVEITGEDVIYTDLLLDVVVEGDGSSRVLDLDELIAAHEANGISTDEMLFALGALDRLLKIIYKGNFKELTQNIDDIWVD